MAIFDAALGPEGPALLDFPPGRGRPWTLASRPEELFSING
jgi:hypothetical protein